MNSTEILLVFSVLFNALYSAEALACGPYRVAFYETGSLYYRNDSGKFVGIDNDLISELSRRTGCKFETFLDSRIRTWAALSSGDLDMTVSAISTPDREVFAQFIPYIQNNRNYLMLRNEQATQVHSLSEFSADRTLRLGIIRSFVHGRVLDPWIASLRAEGRVVDAADTESLARLLAIGRIDGFFSQPVVWGPLLKRNQLEGKVQKLDVAPQDNANLGLVLSRKRVSEDDVLHIRRAMDGMRADGTLETIYARYLDQATARSIAATPRTQ